MPKISIDQKGYENSPAKMRMVQLLFKGTFIALERLGPATHTIKIIEITPNEVPSPGRMFINVKVVISSNNSFGHQEQDHTRLESSFNMFCNNNMLEFMSQGIVRTFQEITAELASRLNRRTNELSNTLASLGLREGVSGNNLRCRICGHVPKEQEKDKPCVVCARCTSH